MTYTLKKAKVGKDALSLARISIHIFIKKRKRKPGRLKVINLKKLKEVSSRNDFPE